MSFFCILLCNGFIWTYARQHLSFNCNLYVLHTSYHFLYFLSYNTLDRKSCYALYFLHVFAGNQAGFLVLYIVSLNTYCATQHLHSHPVSLYPASQFPLVCLCSALITLFWYFCQTVQLPSPFEEISLFLSASSPICQNHLPHICFCLSLSNLLYLQKYMWMPDYVTVKQAYIAPSVSWVQIKTQSHSFQGHSISNTFISCYNVLGIICTNYVSFTSLFHHK